MSKILLKNQSGFTLLELLVVIAILTTMAYMSLGSVVNDTSRIRYEDTNTRLEAIRTAVIGNTGKVMWEHGVLSGYVADNGVLPGSINDLVTKPTGFVDFDVIDDVPWQNGVWNYTDGTGDTFTDCSGCSSSSYPYESYTFDGTPDYTIPHTDDSDALTTDELTIGLGIRNLSKGYKGRYLTGLSRAGKFPDGWGTVTPESDSGETPPDCPDSGNVGDSYYDRNHGWCIDASVSNALEILSYGLDGDLDTLTSDVYEEDQSIDIEPNDWLVNINGATVQVDIIGDIEIENILQPATSDNISIGAGLIVYENSSSGWTITDTQYHTLLATFTDTELKVPSSSFQYSDGTDIDRGYKFKKDAPFTLSFPPKPISGTTAGHEINVPPGEHLLVLFVQHKVGTNEQTTPVFLVNRANTPTTDEIPDAGVIYTQKVKFFPGGGVPDMTLVIN